MPRRFRRLRPVAAALATGAGVVLVTVGPTVAPAGGSAAARVDGEITVSAASSLARAFDRMGAVFSRRHPGATVRFNYGSSSALAAQIEAGAPADVYAAADRASMDRLVARGAVTDTPVVLARNTMTIAVKRGNPRRVRSLRDLASVPVVALCNPSAPCGVYAARILAAAGVTIPESRITRGADATATLGAVATGDADAAVVYATDVPPASPAVAAVPVPATENVDVVYPVAALADSDRPKVAAAFVRFATSARGRRILEHHGFLAA